MDRKKLPLEPCHLGVPSGASKTISEPILHLSQTVYLRYTDTKTISKRTEMRFDMTHITLEFHRVRPKWFLSLRYVRCKLWTNPASRLVLSLNGPKGAYSWASSHRSTIGCIQNYFYASGTFGANRGPILHPNGPKWDSIWPTSCRSSIQCVQNNLWAYGTYGANRAPILRQD
jgi:hypothetical protein